MNKPLSNCCNAPVRIEHVGEDDDPIRELFCTKCNKICDINHEGKQNA